jgi:hypothetical protein
MRNIQRLGVAACVLLAAVAVVGAAGRTGALPPRYAPNSLDGGLTIVENPVDGRAWAVWAYRAGAEYDLALSVTDSNGHWQLPTFIGQGDRRNQVQPSLVVDASGTMYLAFVDGPERRLLLTALRVDETEWSPARTLSDPGARTAKPILRVLGQRLVVAYTASGQVRLSDYAISGGGLVDGTSDGSDPFDRSKEPPPSEKDPPPPANDGDTKTPTPKT